MIRLTMAPSISLKESKLTTMRVERRLMVVPEVTGVVSRVGRGEVGERSGGLRDSDFSRRWVESH